MGLVKVLKFVLASAKSLKMSPRYLLKAGSSGKRKFQKLFSKFYKEEIDMNWKINSFLPEVVQENFTVNKIKRS
jgi:hypothetical protein